MSWALERRALVLTLGSGRLGRSGEMVPAEGQSPGLGRSMVAPQQRAASRQRRQRGAC